MIFFSKDQSNTAWIFQLLVFMQKANCCEGRQCGWGGIDFKFTAVAKLVSLKRGNYIVDTGWTLGHKVCSFHLSAFSLFPFAICILQSRKPEHKDSGWLCPRGASTRWCFSVGVDTRITVGGGSLSLPLNTKDTYVSFCECPICHFPLTYHERTSK